jgi:hypothetical protein
MQVTLLWQLRYKYLNILRCMNAKMRKIIHELLIIRRK